jgi:glycosyltransferase involved in cell wall biosynthesis
MLEKGITNCDVLIQGVDPLKFYPIEREKTSDKFIIFSGGKFELRKGQDIILRAFKMLQDKYDDIILVNCWFNLWPHTIQPMASSPHIKLPNALTSPWRQFMNAVYEVNGLRADRIETYDLLPNYMLRGVIGCTDIGIFPNRCEGGTNLVMMEYMACAKPVIASNTSGHRDIVNAENSLLLEELKDIGLFDPKEKLIARWQEPSLEELVEKIEYAYHNRDAIRQIGQRAGEDMKMYTWEKSAKELLRLIGME